MPVYKDEQRGTWYYAGKYKDVFGKQKNYFKRGFKKQSDAKKEEYKFLLNVKAKTSVYEYKFKDVVDMFLHHKTGRIKERSIYDMKHAIEKQLVPFFGEMYIDAITIPHINQFQAMLLDSDYKNSYMKTIQGLLTQIFRYAVKQQIVHNNPTQYMEYVKKTNEEVKSITFYTFEDYKRFKKYLHKDFELAFDLLYYTGMRISELQSRKWSDLNIEECSLLINSNYDTKTKAITRSTKNGTIRTIYLNKTLINSLKKQLEWHMSLPGFTKDKYILGYDIIIPQKTVENHKEKAIKLYNENEKDHLHRIRIHDFRHSHVSLLINNKVDSFTIAERLGHSKDMVERVYGHMFPEKRKKILDVLDNL